MPQSSFSLPEITPLRQIPPGGRIHLIGVAGVAMAQLAVELTKQGFQVSGSDKDFYEPMGTFLRNSSVTLFQGFSGDNLSQLVDLVVIGNAVSYGNVEVKAVEERGIPYTCFPRLLEETIITGKRSIVVAGTHGKSTTTALIASTLRKLGADPSYFVGGISQDLPVSLFRGQGSWSVVEGDEYDTAFFAKVPKFAFYKPEIAIINAIEYDHADIYPDVESIVKEFRGLLLSIPQTGVALCCIDYPHIKSLLKDVKASLPCKVVTFGSDANADLAIKSRKQEGLVQRVHASGAIVGEQEFTIPLSGLYNAKNALVTLAVAAICGYRPEDSKGAIASFKSVKRRQEVRFDAGGVTLIEDFAHHPTAVQETLLGMREAFPGRKIWAIFEPRSNTSRRKVFQAQYIEAFKNSDEVVLCQVSAKEIDQGIELIDVPTLSDQIRTMGVSSRCLPDPQSIKDFILKNITTHDVIVVMSNGSFGGLPAALERELKERG